ncbi:hypothetical protein DFH09DRAFT_1320183 [Mycena vulgaris]|nr:hypothetical protein DFH09DRAFT_1320183 [Mycena vulgaris]
MHACVPHSTLSHLSIHAAQPRSAHLPKVVRPTNAPFPFYSPLAPPLYSPSVIPSLRILAFGRRRRPGLAQYADRANPPDSNDVPPAPSRSSCPFLFSILAPRPVIFSLLCPPFLRFAFPLCLCFSARSGGGDAALTYAWACPRVVCPRLAPRRVRSIECATRMPSASFLRADTPGTPAPPDSKTWVRRSAALARIPKPRAIPALVYV